MLKPAIHHGSIRQRSLGTPVFRLALIIFFFKRKESRCTRDRSCRNDELLFSPEREQRYNQYHKSDVMSIGTPGIGNGWTKSCTSLPSFSSRALPTSPAFEATTNNGHGLTQILARARTCPAHLKVDHLLAGLGLHLLRDFQRLEQILGNLAGKSTRLRTKNEPIKFVESIFTWTKCSSVMPRVVSAGVPMRTPP